MRKGLADFAPLILLASWPFMSFLATNSMESGHVPRVMTIWLFYLALSLSVVLIARLVFRGMPVVRLSVLGGGLSVWGFSYLSLVSVLAGWGVSLGTWRLLIWVLIATILAVLVLRFVQVEKLRVISITIAAAMLVVPAGVVAAAYLQPRSTNAEKAGLDTSNQSVRRNPNVYWFLLDAYIRPDILKKHAGFDNSPFTQELEARGFLIGTAARSNFPSTEYSLSTTLAMDYYLPIGEVPNPDVYTHKLQGSNSVVSRFKAQGYGYIFAENGSVNLRTRCGGIEDRCIADPVSSNSYLSQVEVELLRMTPLYPVIRRLRPGWLHLRLTNFGDVVGALEADMPNNPYFLFAHVLSPHLPNRYNRDCSLRKHIEWDFEGDLNNPDVLEGYLIDVGCLGVEVIDGVDRILSWDKSDPIIIIQADHGLPVAPPGEQQNQNLEASYAILHAAKMPGECADLFDSSMTSVNTFRMVFSCVEREPIPFLPDRYFRGNDDGFIQEIQLN